MKRWILMTIILYMFGFGYIPKYLNIDLIKELQKYAEPLTENYKPQIEKVMKLVGDIKNGFNQKGDKG